LNRRPGAGDLKAQPAVGPDSPGLAAGRRVSRGCSGVAEGAIVGVEPNAWPKHCVDPCIELICPDMRVAPLIFWPIHIVADDLT
jgi:hypothetical protein